MRTFEPGTHVRVMQEGWGVFQNLPATAARFEQLTGCTVEVTLTVIPEMWELMERSFSGEDPPFDLVGVDDLLLIEAARAGRVMALDDYIARDGYSLDDFTPQAIEAVSDRGKVYGLPYCDVSSVLIYRADLFERYGVTVPATMDELAASALAVQAAVRADGQEDFYGITLRGAPNCGLNFWIVGSTWGPSWGARWYDADGRPTLDTPELRGAVEHYCSLLQEAGPPESSTMTFIDCMACYAAGRAAMVVEPANEASILYDEGGPVAEGTRTALIPAGPLGTRHGGLYCPPYAIPSRAQSKEAAWELAQYLCAPEQVLQDARESGFVEVSRNSVMSDPSFAARFRPEILETTRASRAFARGERPVTRFGMEVGNRIGDQIVRALTRELTVGEALQEAERTVAALGHPDGL
ncbi:MAG: polyol transport system substrate-binding protein [Gaiellaceae bacterium]|jgi:ABC-type glycerol-3-phosphate transport system substrate-binding protein|nr:polyol transport system substrate-binding protein [Gaiellaceae bacterium]